MADDDYTLGKFLLALENEALYRLIEKDVYLIAKDLQQSITTGRHEVRIKFSEIHEWLNKPMDYYQHSLDRIGLTHNQLKIKITGFFRALRRQVGRGLIEKMGTMYLKQHQKKEL